jgi:uncharacterized membrane protein
MDDSHKDELRVLIAGESWITHSIHQKGFDSFTTTRYEEGVRWLREALEAAGIRVEYLPNHLASSQFPSDTEQLGSYSAVILSDIGANTLLLHPDTFERSIPTPNRLSLLREYVSSGGGLVMVGGYMTFQGIEGRARYGGTSIEEILPVTLLPGDDRIEIPEGRCPRLVSGDHPIVANLPQEWPHLLGYNRVLAKPDATVIANVGEDPLLVAWDFGKGRTVAFTSDCAPHWCPENFLSWAGYGQLWQQLVQWVAATK